MKSAFAVFTLNKSFAICYVEVKNYTLCVSKMVR